MYGQAVGKDDITASMKREKTFSAAPEEKARKEKEKKTEQNILKKILFFSFPFQEKAVTLQP